MVRKLSAHSRVRASQCGARPGLGLLAFLLVAPALAEAQEKAASTEDVVEDEAEGDSDGSAADMAAGVMVTKESGAWSLNANLTTFVGQGVFATGKGRSGTVLSQMSLSPSMSVGPVLLFASQAVQLEYTDPDNRTGRRVAVFDTTFGAQYPMKLEAINTRLALSGGIRLPTSWQSRAQGSLGGVFGGATALWKTPVTGLLVVVGLRGQLNTSLKSLRATGEVDGPSFEQEAVNCLSRSGEDPSDACGPIPNVANLSGQLQVSYTVKKFTASVGVGVQSFVSAYSGPDDEFTAANARSGVNASVFSSGTVQVTYPATDHIILSGGLSSFQPIQTADGKSMRFPLWNFNGVANGYSSLFLGSTFLF